MKHIQFILLFFFIFSSCDSSDPEQTNTSDKDVVSRPTPEKRVGINDLVLLYTYCGNRISLKSRLSTNVLQVTSQNDNATE